VSLPLQDRRADVSADLVIEGGDGGGKFGVTLNGSFPYFILLGQTLSGIRTVILTVRFLIAMPAILACLQVLALPAQIPPLLGRQVATPELVLFCPC
jgi:hypothetical protein